MARRRRCGLRWSWVPRTADKARNLRELRGHVARHGWSSINEDTISRSGSRIGHWLNHIRSVDRKGLLPPWLKAGLESIPGWTAEPRRSRQRSRVARLAAFVAKHGWGGVKEALVVRGDAIGAWVSYCRAGYRKGILPGETIAGLEAIPGWSWSAPNRGPRSRRGGPKT